ncbi:MAG: hypothetical protein M1548_00815 [Actinobacteria bacterium]|nr:hypothetical protein [Actinomycetota bacterium]
MSDQNKEMASEGKMPKKRRMGKVVLGILGVLVLALTVGTFLGVVPVLSGLAGTAKPKDLGVRYSEKDFNTALAKTPLKLKNKIDGPIEGTEMVYTGQALIDATFTEAELSALLSYNHSSRFPVSQVQVRLLGGNRAEASGMVTYKGIKYPVYVSGSASLTSGKSVTGSVSAAQVSGISVPVNYWPQAENYVINLVNRRLARMDGLNIQKVELSEGKARVVGTMPAEAKRVRVNR